MPTAALTASGRKGMISAVVSRASVSVRARHPFVFTPAKIVQGERRTKRKAVQSERKGKIKNVSLYIAFSELQPAL